MNNEQLRNKSIPFEVKLKYLVQELRFSLIGTVSKVNSDGTRVDVTLPYLDCNLKPVVFQGIEVLRPGTHDLIIKYKPSVGDVAVVLSMQDYWLESKFNQRPEKQSVQAEPYSNVTMKAILVQTNEDNEDATIIDVKEDEIEITAPLKTTITCKDAVTITAESTTDITCKDAVTITAESTTELTCNDTVTATCEKALTVTCKDDATIDASNKNVTVKSSKVTINDHLTVE